MAEIKGYTVERSGKGYLANDGAEEARWTRDPAEAKIFESKEDALREGEKHRALVFAVRPKKTGKPSQNGSG